MKGVLSSQQPPVFPLYLGEGGDPTRFAYAVCLLNKDVDQLLAEHGLEAGGARHLLGNLHRLLDAGARASAGAQLQKQGQGPGDS